jgi:3-oxoacyl-[acyl-carrier protein] reductase
MMLKNKTCLVTGGSRGIGKAIVNRLVKDNAHVIFTYVQDKVATNELINDLSEYNPNIQALQMDVSNRESVKNVISSIRETNSHIDVLVNNAGVNKPEDFDKITDNDWDNVVDVNLKGPFIVTQEALPLLKRSNSASVINIGSVSGQYGGPRTAHYAASKAGLISLGQVIARFGAQYNIRCNTISVGLIASEMAEAGLQSAAVQQASENILLKRFGEQSEVADVLAFLASDESSYITAQTINVNGGLYF